MGNGFRVNSFEELQQMLSRGDSSIDVDVAEELRRVYKSRESAEQKAVFRWVRKHEVYEPRLKLYHAVPNETVTDSQRIYKVQMGLRKGMLDTHLPIAADGYIGMWIEYKYGKNTLTDEQSEYKAQLEGEGHLVHVCCSRFEGIKELKNYLNYNPDEAR